MDAENKITKVAVATITASTQSLLIHTILALATMSRETLAVTSNFATVSRNTMMTHLSPGLLDDTALLKKEDALLVFTRVRFIGTMRIGLMITNAAETYLMGCTTRTQRWSTAVELTEILIKPSSFPFSGLLFLSSSISFRGVAARRSLGSTARSFQCVQTMQAEEAVTHAVVTTPISLESVMMMIAFSWPATMDNKL